jgi:hypothetical protein
MRSSERLVTRVKDGHRVLMGSLNKTKTQICYMGLDTANYTTGIRN